MPTQITVLKIFVASPSDIIEERKILEEIVSDINKQLGSVLGINFEIVKWETDTHPDIGNDAQSVITKQIGESYDIFIGILWTRFGTPTKNALSGTEEEFRNAYKRSVEEQSVKVMFYFNDTPVSISNLDQVQVAKIKDFQSNLGELGVYYWQYKNIDDFSRYIKMHLGAVMKEYSTNLGQKKNETKEQSEQPSQQLEALVEKKNKEEEGFLDLVISSIDDITAGGEAINRIVEIIRIYTKMTEGYTGEINNLEKPINPNQARSIINKFAEEQENFVERMKVEIPILSSSFRSGIDNWVKSAELWEDFNSNDKSVIDDALEKIREFKNAISQAKVGTITLSDSIQASPRMTTRFNHSKRRVVEMLGTLIDEYTVEESLCEEAEKVFVQIMENN